MAGVWQLVNWGMDIPVAFFNEHNRDVILDRVLSTTTRCLTDQPGVVDQGQLSGIRPITDTCGAAQDRQKRLMGHDESSLE